MGDPLVVPNKKRQPQYAKKLALRLGCHNEGIEVRLTVNLLRGLSERALKGRLLHSYYITK